MTLKKIAEDYCLQTLKDSKPLTVSGLALALGMSRKELIKLAQWPDKEGIKKFLLLCESFAEEKLLEGKNTTGVIFALKNNFDWKDKTDKEEGEIEVIIKHPWEKNNSKTSNSSTTEQKVAETFTGGSKLQKDVSNSRS